ncbi:hypothetical protein CK203_115843 [Vitis vinifera]|uniref:Uncharacterized protein n=1 Tax=Vitis vinifera TaxID=29760 RepID=A0A438CSC1_VITVI|nr:hypothetical protein CK203_115843 [Vitis vinifera]
MIDRPKEQDQIDMVLQNLQPRFARRLVGIPFQDLKSLVHAAFSIEEVIAQGLWTDTTPSPDSKGKKSIGSSSRSGEIKEHDIERCAALHHAIQDLIDSRLVSLAGPSVTTNPLPTHSTHAAPHLPSLQ